MATCEEVRFEGDYLYIRFAGKYRRLKTVEQNARLVLAATREHKCTDLLLDVRDVQGLEAISTLDEHLFAKFVTKIRPFRFRAVILVSDAIAVTRPTGGKHFEMAAKNRGGQVAVVSSFEEAVTYIRGE